MVYLMVYVYEMKNSVIVKKRAQVVLGEGGPSNTSFDHNVVFGGRVRGRVV